MSNFIATYGTLRQGMYNNNRFPMEFMRQRTIPGFKLYDLGPYPMVIFTGNEEDRVVFDIFHVTKRTKESIDAMEVGAGYSIMTIPVWEDLDADVYIYDRVPEYAREVASGDYVKYINEKTCL